MGDRTCFKCSRLNDCNILEIMKDVFGTEDIDRTVSQKNCEKWDSLAHLNLIVELETEFGVSFEPEEIGEMKCFDDVVKILSNKIK